MKKKTAGLLAAMLAAVLFSGCGGEENKPLSQLDTDKYVTLGDYNNLTINVSLEPVQVDEAQLEQLVYEVYCSYVTEESGVVTDRVVEVGDTVNIDYEGKRNGIAFAGGSNQGDFLTIGSGGFIDGFEDGLIGVMPGETVDLDLSFPDPYPPNPDLAGQPVVFTVTVNYIFPTPEDMQDEVVAGMEIVDVNTVEELRQFAYDYLYEITRQDYNLNLENAVIEALVASCVFEELPESLLEESRKTFTANLENTAASYGYTPDTFAAYYYMMSAEELIDTYAPEGARQNLALQAVANKEGLAVDDEELQTLMEEAAVNAGYESVDALMGEVTLEEFRNYFMFERVIDFLMEINHIEKN